MIKTKRSVLLTPSSKGVEKQAASVSSDLTKAHSTIPPSPDKASRIDITKRFPANAIDRVAEPCNNSDRTRENTPQLKNFQRKQKLNKMLICSNLDMLCVSNSNLNHSRILIQRKTINTHFFNFIFCQLIHIIYSSKILKYSLKYKSWATAYSRADISVALHHVRGVALIHQMKIHVQEISV